MAVFSDHTFSTDFCPEGALTASATPPAPDHVSIALVSRLDDACLPAVAMRARDKLTNRNACFHLLAPLTTTASVRRILGSLAVTGVILALSRIPKRNRVRPI